MKIKVISDGTNEGTRVVDAASGVRIENVSSITWIARGGQPPQAVVEFDQVEADVAAYARGPS